MKDVDAEDLGIVEETDEENLVDDRTDEEIEIDNKTPSLILDDAQKKELYKQANAKTPKQKRKAIYDYKRKLIKEGKVRPETQESIIFNSIQKDGFIFDDEDVWKKENFISFKLNDDEFAYGLLFTKYKDDEVKGRVVGKKQIDVPVIITSKGEFYSITNYMQQGMKKRFNNIPDDLPLRWSRNSIKQFLLKETDAVDGNELFNEIKEIYQKYRYEHLEMWYEVNAIWDIGTYFFMLFDAYPIKENRGMKGTAKTKLMSISNKISFNATEIMVNPSEATLFREAQGTKYIDEAEKLFSWIKGRMIADDRVTIINASYKKEGGKVPRIEKFGNRFKRVYYNVYSPTMVSSINGLYGATEDRAIIQICTKQPREDLRGDKEATYKAEDWQGIRDKCYLFAMQNWKEIEKQYDEFENNTSLTDRDFEIWKSLFVIAKFIDENLFKRVKKFAQELTERKKITDFSEGSREYKLLELFWKQLEENGSPVFIKNISDAYPSEEKPSSRSVASTLDKLGFMDFKAVWGKGTCYKIDKFEFQDLIYRISPSYLSSLTSLTSPEKKVIDDKRTLNDYEVSEGKVKEGEEEDKKQVKIGGVSGLSEATSTKKISELLMKQLEVVGKKYNAFQICDYVSKELDIDIIEVDNALDKLREVGDVAEVKAGWIIKV